MYLAPGAPASSFFATAALPVSKFFPMALRHGVASFFATVPAGNKPHLAEKNTPVWLAIWRIWAGFANSQL